MIATHLLVKQRAGSIDGTGNLKVFTNQGGGWIVSGVNALCTNYLWRLTEKCSPRKDTNGVYVNSYIGHYSMVLSE